MRCYKCGNTLPADSQFCQYCGTDLTKANLCSSCGAVLEADMNFCPKCGTRPNTAPNSSTQADTKAQERAVSSNKPIKQRKKWPIVLCACLTIVAAAIGGFFWLNGDQETDPATIAENVLYLEIYDSSDTFIGSASGFLINDGVTLITNYHVIEDAYRIVAMTADGDKQVDVSTILTYDEVADLAILKCDAEVGVLPLTLADSDVIKQGDNVYAAGYPLGLANTLSNGIVSSRYTEYRVDILQITAAISGGSSGGALLNEQGQVIGVICAYYEDGQNLNIAIASNEVSDLLSDGIDEVSLKQFYADTRPQNEEQSDDTGEITYDFYYAEVRTISVADKFTAEYILEKWKSGAATEASMIAIMDEYGADQGGGKLHTVEPGMWIEEVDQWCFDRSRRVGDVAIIETPYGFSICYFSGVVERNIMLVGTSADFPPFEYYDDNGDIVGMEIMLLYAISEEIGYDFEVIDIPFDELMTALADGDINCMAAGVEETSDRNKVATATDPWYEGTTTIGEIFASVFYVNDEDLLTKINAAIKTFKNDGTIQAIIDFYEEEFRGDSGDSSGTTQPTVTETPQPEISDSSTEETATPESDQSNNAGQNATSPNEDTTVPLTVDWSGTWIFSDATAEEATDNWFVFDFSRMVIIWNYNYGDGGGQHQYPFRVVDEMTLEMSQMGNLNNITDRFVLNSNGTIERTCFAGASVQTWILIPR